MFSLAAACDGAEGPFTTRLASDFAPAGHSVSVLGIYKDGRMSAAWDDVAPYFATALGGSDCEIGFSTLEAANGPLASAVDAFARDDGPSDDLLGQLAPAAKGDLVLVVTIAGQLPSHAGDAGAPQPQASATRGGRGRYRPGNTQLRTQSVQDTNVLDVSASLYSVGQGRSVALLALEYSGASVDQAMRAFGDRLARTFPNTRCAGWDWTAKIDPDKLRQSE